MNLPINVLRMCLGCLTVTGVVWAEETSGKIKAASIAGMTDYHGNAFPDVVTPPTPSPTPSEMKDEDGVKLEEFRIDTTRLPLNRIFVTPQKRNVIETFLPGTGVTVTETYAIRSNQDR